MKIIMWVRCVKATRHGRRSGVYVGLVFEKLSVPALKIARTDFKKLRDFLAREGFAFGDRPYQEFLAKKIGVTVNLYTSGKVVIGGHDQVLIGWSGRGSNWPLDEERFLDL
jgi:hypothetical protein